jgi:hypothetical protein
MNSTEILNRAQFLVDTTGNKTAVLLKYTDWQELLILLKDVEADSLRPAGLCAGEFTVPDDFNDPLPGDVQRTFEGE